MSVARLLSHRENPDKLGRRVGERGSITAVLRVLPAGSRPARSQGSWVRAVETHPDVALLRADAKRNLHALVWELARWADWETLTSRPTWERLGRSAGLSRSTVAKWLAWLRERDLLAIVEHGTTPLLRPGVLYNGTEGNLASVYVLCEPSGRDEPSRNTEDRLDEIFLVHENQTPSQKPSITTRQIAPARANPSRPQSGRGTTAASRIPPNDKDYGPQPHNHKDATKREPAGAKIASPWPLWRPTRTRTERLALCERLHEESPPLHAAGSVRRLCHLLRPWLLAGWSARSLLYAIDHTPDQAPWPYAWRSVRELRNPAGWLLHRLSAWRDRDGQVLSDPYATEMSCSTERIVTVHHSPVASNCPAQPTHVRAVAARLRAQLRECRHKRQADARKSRDALPEVPQVPEVPE